MPAAAPWHRAGCENHLDGQEGNRWSGLIRKWSAHQSQALMCLRDADVRRIVPESPEVFLGIAFRPERPGQARPGLGPGDLFGSRRPGRAEHGPGGMRQDQRQGSGGGGDSCCTIIAMGVY